MTITTVDGFFDAMSNNASRMIIDKGIELQKLKDELPSFKASAEGYDKHAAMTRGDRETAEA